MNWTPERSTVESYTWIAKSRSLFHRGPDSHYRIQGNISEEEYAEIFRKVSQDSNFAIQYFKEGWVAIKGAKNVGTDRPVNEAAPD